MLAIHDEPTRAEYLAAIRDYVCTRCVERPPGGPPCLPHGKICGIELHLPELLDSIHRCNSVCIAPYLDENRKSVCECCVHKGSDQCPCPMDTLAVLLVEAVEEVDKRFADRDLQREYDELGSGD